MTDIKFNLNAKVRVKLTPFGMKIWQNDWYDGVPLGATEQSLHAAAYGPVLDSEGYYETMLWDLMRIFGKYLYMGARDMPFENNEMLIIPEPAISQG